MKAKVFNYFGELRRLIHKDKLGVEPMHFMYAAILSLLSALFEGVSVASLIPLTQGLLTMNFDSIRQFRLARIIGGFLPPSFELSSMTLFLILLVLVFTAAILKNIFDYFSSLVVNLQVRIACNGLMKLVFNRYLSFGKQFFDRNNAGYLHNVLLNFTSLVAGPLGGLRTILANVFLIAVYVAMMLKISWRLTVLTIVFMPPLYYVLMLLINRIKKTSHSYAESFHEISGEISNILSCIPLVKLYCAEDKEKKRFAYLSGQLQRLSFSMDKKRCLIQPLIESITIFAALALMVAIVAIIKTGSAAPVGGFLVFLYLLKKFLVSFGLVNDARASLATISGPLEAISEMLSDGGKVFVSEGARIFTGLKTGIELRGLSFYYAADVPVLKEVSVFIEKGKTTAIVGPTGSGKTTIVNLILRFYDCPPGEIFLDGNDIRGFTFKSLLSHVALVSQDTLLFNDTIRSNIIYGLERQVGDHEIMEAFKKAKLHDFVAGLPAGLDTYIGDRGVKLSGGEKQRLSIARALLKGSEILMLDEATSSLDTKTEKLIQEAINEAIKDKTAIVVAHRLSTIKNADKIVVIDNGAVLEEGGLAELLGKKGKFYEYWQEQKFY